MLIIENGIKANKKIKWLVISLLSISSIISIFVIVIIWWSVTEVKSQKPIIPQNIVSKTIHKTIKSFSNFRFPIKRIMGFNSDYPSISLDIKLKNYAKLEEISENNGNGRRDTFVPAILRSDSKTVKAKIRLQGDREIHWANPERWSFRVEIKDDTLLGMRKFSIQHPVTRNYIYEWIFHDFLKREGLIGLNYQFVTLNVNGDSRGVYAVEEKSDKILIESNRRRNGPIFKFEFSGGMDSENFWDNIRVSPYQKSQWIENNPLLLAEATESLNGFINSDLSVEEVFDTEKLAKFFAIVDLFSMFHGTIPDGIRLYYNPITKLFEPIGNDGHFLDKAYPVLVSQLHNFRREEGFWGYGKWYERLFDIDNGNNLKLYENYVKELNRLSAKNYLESYFEEIDLELNNLLDFIYSDFPFSDLWSMHPLTGVSPLFYYDKNKIFDKRSFIKERLKLNSPLYISNIKYSDNSLFLNIKNKSKLPVKIKEIEINNKTFRPNKNEYVESMINRKSNESKEVSFLLNNFNNAQALNRELIGKIKYSIIGMNEIYEQSIIIGSKFSSLKEDGNLSDFDFIIKNGRNFYLGPGKFEFDKNLVIPKGVSFEIFPGTDIDLLNSASIISYSPIIIKGDENNKIRFTSSDSSGQGLIVIQAKGQSQMDFVDFTGQSLNDLNQSITSVLTFYESDVSINNSTFTKNISEDVINIIRSDFKIDQITINDSVSDGIDIDFGNGSISNSHFYNIGNDSIDFSGSFAELSQIISHSSGDKAISIGEGSSIYAKDINISNSKIAFAIKDSSYLELIESSVKDTDIGFTIFQKKLEFNPSKAEVWRYTSKNVNQEFLLEEGSSLIFDGKLAKSNSVGLKDELYDQ